MKRYKALVISNDTGNEIIIEGKTRTKKVFIEMLKENGYKVDRNKIKEPKLFDYIVEYTECTPQDWKLKEIPQESKQDNTMTFKIPDSFYEHGTPFVTDYMGDKFHGLGYKNGGEEAYEMASAFGGTPQEQYSVVSLLSPWVLGWNNDFDASDIELDFVDIPNRTVTVKRR